MATEIVYEFTKESGITCKRPLRHKYLEGRISAISVMKWGRRFRWSVAYGLEHGLCRNRRRAEAAGWRALLRRDRLWRDGVPSVEYRHFVESYGQWKKTKLQLGAAIADWKRLVCEIVLISEDSRFHA